MALTYVIIKGGLFIIKVALIAKIIKMIRG